MDSTVSTIGRRLFSGMSCCYESQLDDQTMPKKDKVKGWGKKDVSRWLEKRNLVKFVPLFQKHSVVGSDIVESNLVFLHSEDVTVDDREEILAEIYMLLHPDNPKLLRRSTPSPSLRSVHPKDREKVEAAMQVAKSPPSRHTSPQVVLIGSRSRSPSSLTPRKTLTIPVPKPRSKSESGAEGGGLEGQPTPPPSPGRKYLKRKSTPAVHDYLQRGIVQNASLFEILQDEGQVCVECVKVQRSEVGSKFGFSFQPLPDNSLLVTNVRLSDVPLQVGDRILELNGVILPGHKGSTVESMLSKAASLDIVVVRNDSRLSGDVEQPAVEQAKHQQEVVMNEVRWQSLRQLLTSLQQKSFDPLALSGTLTNVEDMADTKKRVTLEMEVEELQRTVSDLSHTINSLQTKLKGKEEELTAVRDQRDRAVDTLRTRLLSTCSPKLRDKQGHTDLGETPTTPRAADPSQDLHNLFFEHIKASLASMEKADTTKDDVLDVLRELTQASRRHAQFVDRLIDFVIERAPWMIDELNALEDESELPETPPKSPSAATAAESEFDEENAIIV
ncbi:uncharacterized protein [Littorina saxatilis]|uniref:uncharacterized protein isoform X2 n=1 Tax=Littorina saxatilis TaxID=31220 RepID=UPI0038B42A3E